MIAIVVLISIVVLAAGYFAYGRLVSRWLGLDDSRPTPACEMQDGVDYVPAKASLLLGQHFSAIAAAGPIVGPILACLWFGWLPALLWILLGSIFIGGVHDFTSLVASVRHKAASIGEIVKRYMSRTSQILFLIFVWLALVYVVIAFTDITAQTFTSVMKDNAFGPGVAVSSFLYLLLGILMGIVLFKMKMGLGRATAVFIPLVLLVIWLGTRLPGPIVTALVGVGVKQWELILLAYCFIASLLPMWLLLQPRGYLGGWFLYITMAIALIGALFGGFRIEYPALNVEGLHSLANGKSLIPILFITVACGACSGFHGIVASGTTSKQICRESDTRPVGYGAMILEGLVAVLALATVMFIPKGAESLKDDPNIIYGKGLANYMGLIGINFNLALAFALLAFSTFVYDTLDVCTRLARYILQELFGWASWPGRIAATFITLIVPAAFLMLAREKAYLVAWPIFGTSNQLLASLTLLAVSVWLIKTGKNAVFTLIPMAFMLVMTLWSLGLQIAPWLESVASGTRPAPDVTISGVCGSVLLVLSVWLIVEAVRMLSRRRSEARQ
ncbi:MAG: carbon starvation protein A [Candidatus Krumholzibacteria bacterium]|nr:carbon starvation protein A [Candidatus Krumholzibacteria bacterium]